MFTWLKNLRRPIPTLEKGRLHLPAVRIAATGQVHDVVLQRIPGRQPPAFEVVSVHPPLPQAAPQGEQAVAFCCNICGAHNQAALPLVSNREAPSCSQCRSSLRMRSVIRALSLALFGKSLSLPAFPEDKKIRGLGMSDWDGYALPLATKLDYTNTFYHQAPKLDITDPSGWQENAYDFIISTDVFEHIPPPVSRAFENTCRLLKPGGVFVFTVPFTKTGVTQEHFPDLHDYRIAEENGKRVLYNRTRDGREQVFEDLIFHGGEGFTLEMRLFSEPSLIEALQRAGFGEITVHSENEPEIGVIWPMSWAVPMTARKSKA
jgi:SAM-dependent methyltransferase